MLRFRKIRNKNKWEISFDECVIGWIIQSFIVGRGNYCFRAKGSYYIMCADELKQIADFIERKEVNP